MVTHPHPPARSRPSLLETVAGAHVELASPLDTVVQRAVRAAFAGTAGIGSLELAGQALAELVALDATRPGPWFAVGLLRGFEPGAMDQGLLPPTADLAYFHLLGQLTALVERGDDDGLAAAALASEPAVQRLVGSTAARHLAAPVLAALVATAPRRVAALLGDVSVVFVGWERFMAALRRQGCRLIRSGDLAMAERLLRAGEDVLEFWAGLEDDLGASMAMELQQAQLRVLRVTARRSGGDFPGARRLLVAVPEELLPRDARADLACEWALVEAEVGKVGTLDVPRSLPERAALGERLNRGQAHLDAALEASPDHALARVLCALGCLCRGDEVGAVHHLGPEQPSPPSGAQVGPAARVARALAGLRLAEPGTDEAGE